MLESYMTLKLRIYAIIYLIHHQVSLTAWRKLAC
jgi:hypothetical protein